MSEQQENETPAAPEVAESKVDPPQEKKETATAIPVQGGVEKKKRNRPPVPIYITDIKDKLAVLPNLTSQLAVLPDLTSQLAEMKSHLQQMREEKKASRAAKEANRKKVHFEEPVTQHQPEEEIVAEQDEEMSELEADPDPVESESEEEVEEEVEEVNPFARKMSRIL